MFRKRDKDLFVFGSWLGKSFSDNSKWLYLYCLSQGIKAVWITDNPEVFNQLSNKKMPVQMKNSKDGITSCKKAKYVITCTNLCDVNDEFVGGAVLINLWHGIPLKKIGYDDYITGKAHSIINRIAYAIKWLPLRKQYAVSTSGFVTSIFESAFRLNRRHVLELGYPRNDCFFNGTLKKTKYSKHLQYNFLVSYLPTHRNEGKTNLNVEKIFDLGVLNEFCKKNNILFLIKKHFYHSSERSNLSNYSNIIDLTGKDIDPQQLLFDTDILISDYSGAYIDYLLLDRPIVFYAFDFQNYLLNDREMYINYLDAVTSEPCYSFDELMIRIDGIVKSGFKLDERHHKVKNLFFSENNQGVVSPKVIDGIRKL